MLVRYLILLINMNFLGKKIGSGSLGRMSWFSRAYKNDMAGWLFRLSLKVIWYDLLPSYRCGTKDSFCCG